MSEPRESSQAAHAVLLGGWSTAVDGAGAVRELLGSGAARAGSLSLSQDWSTWAAIDRGAPLGPPGAALVVAEPGPGLEIAIGSQTTSTAPSAWVAQVSVSPPEQGAVVIDARLWVRCLEGRHETELWLSAAP